MITFNNIVERFEIFAENHFFIKSFSFGSPDDVDLSKFEEFPLMHLVYTGSTYDAGTKTYNLEVYILDVPHDKKGKVIPQKEAISDSEQCAEDIIADIRSGGNIFLFAQDYEVVNATTTPLEEETKNVLSGVLLDLSVAIPYEWDACNAPIDGVSPGGGEIIYARRGVLRMLTLDGATDVQSVRTIKVTNGTLTDDGDGVVTLDSGGGGAESLNDLRDVTITGSILSGQILRADSAGQIINATPLPLSLSQLSDVLLNQQTIATGQALMLYNSGGQTYWGNSFLTFADLTDVDTTGKVNGSTLVYNGSKWVVVARRQVSITSLIGSAPITIDTSSGAETPTIGILAATTTEAGSMSAPDKDKLNGIEAGADITDATNVASAGALMAASAQLTGDLDTQTHEIKTTESNGNIIISPNGTGVLEVKGDTNSAALILNCEQNTHGVRIQSPPHSANATYTLTLPTATGSDGQALTTDGSGALAFTDVSNNAGTVTSVATGTGLTGGTITGSGTIALADTAVTAAAYTNANITIDAQGRITAATNGTSGGVTSVNSLTGGLTLTAGANVTISDNGSDTITIASTGGGGGGLTAVTGTSPIASSGGNTPNITISAATTSAAGSMSGADKTKLDNITTNYATNSLNTGQNILMTATISVADDKIVDVMGDALAARDNANTKKLIGFHTGSNTIVLQGMIDAGGAISGAAAGSPLWLGALGTFSATAPTTTNEFSRVVGYYIGAIGSAYAVYFNPSKDWIQIDS